MPDKYELDAWNWS